MQARGAAGREPEKPIVAHMEGTAAQREAAAEESDLESNLLGGRSHKKQMIHTNLRRVRSVAWF